MKLVVSPPVEEIEGEVFQAKVTKFGTSAHIPFSRKFLFSEVKIIVPYQQCFLNTEEIHKIVSLCHNKIPKSKKKTEYLNSIKNFENKKFTSVDLMNISWLLDGETDETTLKFFELYNPMKKR